jgi:hypothetical protein
MIALHNVLLLNRLLACQRAHFKQRFQNSLACVHIHFFFASEILRSKRDLLKRSTVNSTHFNTTQLTFASNNEHFRACKVADLSCMSLFVARRRRFALYSYSQNVVIVRERVTPKDHSRLCGVPREQAMLRMKPNLIHFLK